MARKGISRRDCLALLGAGAAAAITPASGKTNQTAAKPVSVEDPNRMSAKVGAK